jgi:formate hydrogenlyase transcriptional activator
MRLALSPFSRRDYDSAVSDADVLLRAALEDRLRFERLVCDISARFVNIDPAGIDDAIRDAQRQIVEALDLDRSSLFQRFDAGGPFVFTHYWSREGLDPPPLDIPLAEHFPWCLDKILKGELIAFASVSELPEGIRDRDTVQRVGTKSNVTVPLKAGGEVIGALAFGALRHERPWPPEIVNRLVLMGQVFAGALAQVRANAALRAALAENSRLREQLVEENVYLRQEVEVLHGPSEVMGQSAAIRQVLAQIEQVAPTNTTVLLTGETGTGKELLATAIHDRSARRGRAMVRVNCGAIPESLVESELFGREKGAYTGALARQMGRFELASGSTIFLDEIGDVPLDLQVKLLRVLESRQIERLGSPRSIEVDVRVIAATNHDLDAAIASGRFREDLYYRLNVFAIRVPPLRERTEDIPTLVWAFVADFSRTLGKRIEVISKEHMRALQQYRWPGNVRELRNVVERAVIVSNGPKLAVALPRPRKSEPRSSTRLADVEREHVQSVLESAGWKIRGPGGAAEALGLKPSTLEGRMAKLAIRRPRRG